MTGDTLAVAALIAAGLGLCVGGVLRRLTRRLWAPPALFLAGSAALLAAGPRIPAELVVTGMLALAAAGAAWAVLPDSTHGAILRTRRLACLVGLGVLLAVAGCWFYFRSDTSRVNTWEAPILWNFEQEIIQGHSTWEAFTARRIWRQGLLASADDSLLYGFPTLVLLRDVTASTLTLRLAAALLGLGSLLFVWIVTKRFWGAETAAWAAFFWLFAPPFTIYGAYGTSVTAMWATLWVAMGAVFLFVSAPSVSRAIMTAAALYLSTLHYAPGRLFAVGLLLLALLSLFLSAVRGHPAWLPGFCFAACVAAFLGLNLRYGNLTTFYAARGEHLLGIRNDAQTAREWLPDRASPQMLSWRETAVLALRLVQSNIPSFLEVVAPVKTIPPGQAQVGPDPPHLPLLVRSAIPLVIWGLMLSFKDRRFALAALFAIVSTPLLLSNRVDMARASVLLPLLVIWGGRGASDLFARLVKTGRWFSATAAAGLFVAAVAFEVGSSFIPLRERPNPIEASVLAEMRTMEGGVRLGLRTSYENFGRAWLLALDRLRLRRELLPPLLSPRRLQFLQADPEAHPEVIEEVVALAHETALLLGPASDFAQLQPFLKARGLKAEFGGSSEYPLLRIEESAAPPEKPDAVPER